MSSPRFDVFVSVVVPVRGGGEWIGGYVRGLAGVLRDNYSNYEMIVVDDCAPETVSDALRAASRETECLRVIRLARPVGADEAVMAGLEGSIGDYVVVLRPESDPPSMIASVVEACRQGTGMAVAVEKNPRPLPLPLRVASEWFHAYCRKFMNLELHPGARYLRAFSRASLNAVLQMRHQGATVRSVSSMAASRPAVLEYEPVWQPGADPKEPLREKINTGLAILVSNSRHPLRIATFLGLLASGVNLLYILYVVVIYFFKRNVAEGWTTLSLQQGVMFFLVFAILTVLSEYVGQVLAEAQKRPSYFVAGEITSNLGLREPGRRNVVTESRDSGGGN